MEVLGFDFDLPDRTNVRRTASAPGSWCDGQLNLRFREDLMRELVDGLCRELERIAAAS